MAGKYVDLTKEQKEEIRRLTQFANRRIASAFKEYEKAGLKLAPADVTGGIQTRQQWDSEKYAISRSVKFASQKEYREQLHWLRQFEHMRPSMTEYTKFQREKTLAGVETSFGTDVPVVLSDMINKLSAPDLTKFWKKFSLMSAKMGLKYGSDAAMQQAIIEFFGEDRQDLEGSGSGFKD
jgi:methionine synthase II (cobalamin-independent)